MSDARARWIADAQIRLGQRLTDGERAALLGRLYDIARQDGISVGIDRMAEAAAKS